MAWSGLEVGEPPEYLGKTSAKDGAAPTFSGVRDCEREYSLVSVDGDHASVPTSERERDFAENRKAFVQAGQICDRYLTGFPRVFRTSNCGNPYLLRQYIPDVRSTGRGSKNLPHTCTCCIRLLVSSSEAT